MLASALSGRQRAEVLGVHVSSLIGLKLCRFVARAGMLRRRDSEFRLRFGGIVDGLGGVGVA